MDDHVCRRFLFVRSWFPDKLDTNKNYQFISDEDFKKYCTSNRCNGDLEKINAVCLLLFNEFFGSSSLLKYHNNINIVDYIMIWLSYMLNLKNNVPGITNLQHFYTTYINNDKYKTTITGVTGYTNYKDLIDQKKYFLDMDSNIISNFYEAFKLLCEMYTNFDEKTSYCSNCSQNAIKFVAKCDELKKDSSITSNSSYNELLSTLSNDYNNFKNYYTSKGGNCKDFPLLPTAKTTQISVEFSEHTSKQTVETSDQSPKQTSKQTVETYLQSSAQSSKQNPEQSVQILEQISEVTSSNLSIGNKLFTVLSIFGAIAFFLGISYKYSLFGFRKRAQKQYLREKIKI
ncbi:BIR protein [Plasmodium berghei]|uniref:BIR protein n=3 Tax=Plasmodium berghei TaxID=5821 RepID=A0A509ARR3_PLABA|nr:BIR protein [Plasmodium berghei ANKA]CXI38989.1 BIR protein [Plasmodium berghei]SCL82776.1 BIR protein [Plasmodium berghei]VUC58055.1 BIR protein [Plasmodium berghei ANKA]|eukprot:XP_034423820.1 BIR protein [Plasmodium berghei ANKA]